MPAGGDDVMQAVTLDPSFKDTSGDPLRKDPALHTTGPPAYLISEGKPGLQESYLGSDRDDFPTAEELATLPRVPQHVPLRIFTIGFVELVERMSYYGAVAVYSNFIRAKRPTATGAALHPSSANAQPGALGKGKQTAFSLTTFNSFWVYSCPILGAWIADTYLGRYRTIVYSVYVAIVGHVLLVASSAPKVLDHPDAALGVFIIGLLIMGLGTGTFKPNISPLIMEQIPEEPMRVEVRNGKKVIVDPAVTATRVYNWFYWFINWGAFSGQMGMVYAERYVGFWLAFMIPTVAFVLAIPVLMYCKKQYVMKPPSGSVVGPAVKLFFKALGTGWTANPIQTVKNWNSGNMWNSIMPSKLGANKPKWYTFDDAWVAEVARGFGACGVFVWVPIYWLAYRQIDNNLTSMCATMQLHGVPNDVFQNLDPITLIIFVPIMDLLVYPALRKRGINFSPIKKITAGFLFGAAGMIWAAVLQYYVYKTSGYYDTHDPDYRSPINVWAVTGVYVIIAWSEIFASVTTLEYAFTKAPKNMRSMVMSIQTFTNAFSAAVNQAFTPLSTDPNLVWNYTVVACLCFVTGILFYLFYRKADQLEDELNLLPTGHLGTAAQAEDLERRLSVAADRRASTAHEADLEKV